MHHQWIKIFFFLSVMVPFVSHVVLGQLCFSQGYSNRRHSEPQRVEKLFHNAGIVYQDVGRTLHNNNLSGSPGKIRHLYNREPGFYQVPEQDTGKKNQEFLNDDQKVVVNKTLLKDIRQALKTYSYDSSFSGRIQKIRLHDTLYFRDLKKLVEGTGKEELLHNRNFSEDSLSVVPEGNNRKEGGETSISIDFSEEVDSVNKANQAQQGRSPGDEGQSTDNEQYSVNKHSPSDSDEIVFKVQIAASREPLSETKLNDRYSGNHQVKRNHVEGWHKYSVGAFKRYTEARKLREKWMWPELL